MKHLITLTIYLALTSSLWGQDTWIRSYGSDENDSSRSIVSTVDGGYILTGSTISFHNNVCGSLNNSYDVVVIRLDSMGNLVWKKTFGGTEYDGGNSVSITNSGHIVVGGITRSDDGVFSGMRKGVNQYGGISDEVFVVLLDGDGNIVWKKTIGGTSEETLTSIITTRDDHIVLTGCTQSSDSDFVKSNREYPDIYVIKMNLDGDIVWNKTLGDIQGETCNSLHQTHDNGFVLVGSTSSTLNDFVKLNKGKTDVLVVKLDLNGNLQWTKTIGGTEVDIGESVIETQDGNIILTGRSHSKDGDMTGMNNQFTNPIYRNDIFVFSLDSTGRLQWKTSYGGMSIDEGYSIVLTKNQQIVLTGRMSSDDGDFDKMNKSHLGGSGRSDIFVIGLDTTGRLRWKRVYGGTNNEYGKQVIPTPEGGIVVTGSFSSIEYDFDGLSLRSGGSGRSSSDIFVMKLDSNGNLNQSTSVDEQTSTSTPLLVSPNPLSTSSTITYTIDTPSPVRIELMNTLGQVIEVVFEGYRESGSHRIPLNVSSLTSGMYSVRMTNDNVVYTTQVCVVR